jgi:hypothetical protein
VEVVVINRYTYVKGYLTTVAMFIPCFSSLYEHITPQTQLSHHQSTYGCLTHSILAYRLLLSYFSTRTVSSIGRGRYEYERCIEEMQEFPNIGVSRSLRVKGTM